MAALEYLTVQDHLWINLQVSGKQPDWNYAKLEEAAYAQYNYGQSKNVVTQAAKYVTGFLKKRPFARANEATAFQGLLIFMAINGFEFNVNPAEALDWFDKIFANPNDAHAKITEGFIEADHHHAVSVEEAGNHLLGKFRTVTDALAKREAAVA